MSGRIFLKTPSGETIRFEALSDMLNHFGFDLKIINTYAKSLEDEVHPENNERRFEATVLTATRELVEEALNCKAIDIEKVSSQKQPFRTMTRYHFRMYTIVHNGPRLDNDLILRQV